MGTEEIAARYAGLDAWPTREAAAALADAQLAAAGAARAAVPALAAAADAAAQRLAEGAGRLIYVGAGASGRLAAQDGAELWPTFGWPDARLAVVMAGGPEALLRSVEGAEDGAEDGAAQIAALAVGPADVVIGVAASGRTPFVLGATRRAASDGALTVGLANAASAPLLSAAAHGVLLDTGAEVVAGSTRMAAGTAQKIALNILSTAVMVRLGRVHGNLMVDMAARNAKLDDRRVAMVRAIVPVDEAGARAALSASQGHVKTAALVAAGLSPDAARAALEAVGGRLRDALEAL